jgi:hypothetical protein
MLDRLKEGVYDSLSSFDHCSKIEMTIKIGKLNWLRELLEEIVPEDLHDDFSAIRRHISFLDHYYDKDKDFSMFRSNADDLLKRDIPTLRENFEKLFKPNKIKELKIDANLTEKYVFQVIKDINDNLRRLIRKDPKDEKEIQDHLEDLLALREYKFEREQVSIPYSTKKYIPDFTSDSQSIAIDVKFCNAPSDERRIIDEINADIPGYKQRYRRILFVIYDMAVIRKLKEYVLDIEESHSDVHIMIIKN